MMNTYVLFGGGLQTLSIARGLKNNRNTLYNFGDKHSVGKYSRFIDHFINIDINSITPAVFIQYINKCHIDIIIPMEDEYAEWLSKHKQQIENSTTAKCAVVEFSLFQKVINKSSLLDFCKQYNIPHPKTEHLTLDNIESIAEIIGFPSLIKPDISNGSRGICRVDNINELKQKAHDIIKIYGECSLQEYLHQQQHYYNAMLYRYHDGSFGYSIVTKITRFYPIKGGSSSFCTTIENPRILEICKQLLNALNWIGFADFDILEKEDGDYRIIEINPRVPASVHAALASGINFGQIIVDDLSNQPKRNMTYTPGEQLRFLGLDIAWFLASPKRFKTSPSWFKFFGKHLHYQEGGSSDCLAMLYSIWSGVKKQLSPSFRKSKSGMN